ncbi:MAG: host-nuclease inhibitor Gam family protein [Odoribacter sp.]
MMKKREKKVLVTGVTSEKMEQAFADYATADAKIQGINAKMDVEMTRIREKYADELTIRQEEKDRNFEILQVYALEHPEFFQKKKSVESAHGTLGFRTGTPKLKTMKGFTWGAVTKLLKEFLPSYVRTTEEAAKDKLLADRDKIEVKELMPKLGIIVDQEESFFVDLKKEDAAAQ